MMATPVSVNHGLSLAFVVNREESGCAFEGGTQLWMYHWLSPHDEYRISRKVFCV